MKKWRILGAKNDPVKDKGDSFLSNLSHNEAFTDILNRRLGRREMLRKTTVLSLAAFLVQIPLNLKAVAKSISLDKANNFQEVAHGADTTHHVPQGYSAQVLLR